MRRLRVLVLTHEDLVPPDSIAGLPEKEVLAFRKEYDVCTALRELGHDLQIVGVAHDLMPIRQVVEGWRPDIVFHLLMEFQDVGIYQSHVASYLELLRVPYAGCNPRGLLLARDKALSKKLLRYHRIATPGFAVARRGRRVGLPSGLRFPLIVKSVDEQASLGIAQASVVRDEAKLQERIEFVHRSVGSDAIVEEYIAGRELTVGVLGNERLRTFPVWEMFFENLPEKSERIATARVKWDLEYQRRVGITTGPARDLPTGAAERIAHLARRVFRALELSGYARIDLRLTEQGRAFVLEANPNPDLTRGEDFAQSAEAAGVSYTALIQRILNTGLRHEPPWKSL